MALSPRPRVTAAASTPAKQADTPDTSNPKPTTLTIESPFSDGEPVELEVRNFVTTPANVGVQRSITVKQGDDFVGIKVHVNLPAYTEEVISGVAYEAASTLVSQYIEAEALKAQEQYATLTAGASQEDADPAYTEMERGDAAPAGEDATVDAAFIREIPTRAALEAFIQEYQITDVDPALFPKNPNGLAAYKEAVIEAAGLTEVVEEGITAEAIARRGIRVPGQRCQAPEA